jgi:hypothetical protein
MSGPLLFLGASAFVCTSATLGVSLLRLRSWIELVLAWWVVACTVVVVTVLMAGAALDHLSAGLVLALNAAVVGLMGLAWLALGGRRRPFLFASPVRAGVLVPALRRDPWALVLVAVAFAEVLWRLTIAYLMPPYAADALWYHLTTVAGWLQAGRIGPSQLSIWSTVYPYNGELLFTWPALLSATTPSSMPSSCRSREWRRSRSQASDESGDCRGVEPWQPGASSCSHRSS